MQEITWQEVNSKIKTLECLVSSGFDIRKLEAVTLILEAVSFFSFTGAFASIIFISFASFFSVPLSLASGFFFACAADKNQNITEEKKFLLDNLKEQLFFYKKLNINIHESRVAKKRLKQIKKDLVDNPSHEAALKGEKKEVELKIGRLDFDISHDIMRLGLLSAGLEKIPKTRLPRELKNETYEHTKHLVNIDITRVEVAECSKKNPKDEEIILILKKDRCRLR
jgi:hypothetical protein